MITIYNFKHGARGVRVAWVCEEMGLTYTPVAFDFPAPSALRAKHPPGTLPFIEDESDVAIGESVAQMLYLAHRYGPTSLLPAAPHEMARVLELTIATEAALGGMMNALMATRFAAPEDLQSNWTDGHCRARASDTLRLIDEGLGDREYLVGAELSLADIAVATALGIWLGALRQEPPPRLAAHRGRMQARPAYQRAAASFGST